MRDSNNLKEYRRKRDFTKTAEPAGVVRSSQKTGCSFTVQKHFASHLHYDFRLEIEGVLKSWAVPKGPSLDPSCKRLAVRVEDHPLDYGLFEGMIPKSEYGGGKVILWDHGTWEPSGDPNMDLKSGKLRITLHGEKLKGKWMLVQMRGARSGNGKNWLLIKEKDEHAKPSDKYDITKKLPHSVLSQIENMKDRGEAKMETASANAKAAGTVSKTGGRQAKSGVQSKLSGRAQARTPPMLKVKGSAPSKEKSPEPSHQHIDELIHSLQLKPELATLVKEPSSGDNWLHEVKYDGYRFLVVKHHGEHRLLTRNGLDWSQKVPHLGDVIDNFEVESAVIDGELVALDEEGLTDFQKLQTALKNVGDTPLHFYAFDLLFLNDIDIRGEPLVKRKDLLETLLNQNETSLIRYSDHKVGEGKAFFKENCKRGLEGMMSKRANSTYEGRRSKSWVKFKCDQRQEFVVGGFTEPQGSRIGFGSLALGFYAGKGRNKKLRYCGRVGTGLDDDLLRELTPKLEAIETKRNPFASSLTAAERRGLHWVKPVLVCEVRFGSWTNDWRIRHAAFLGIRQDKNPKEVTLETPHETAKSLDDQSRKPTKKKNTKTEAETADYAKHDAFRGIVMTNPDRVYYEAGYKKRDIAAYYDRIAETILPFIKDRPLSLLRCPEGVQAPCFFQKHFHNALPEELRSIHIEEKNSSGDYPVLNDDKGLLRLIQLGFLEIHPWGSKINHLEKPDQIVFDLDPGPGTSMKALAGAAFHVRDHLDQIGLKSFLKTSGGKGLHVVVPIIPRLGWDEVKTFAKAFSEILANEMPDRYVAKSTKALRKGRIFIDYLRNGRGATSVAAYSTRAREGANVSMPLFWEDLSARLNPKKFNVKTVPNIIATRTDPWESFFTIKQSISPKIRKLLESIY